MSTLRIAFLHLTPCLQDLQTNRRLINRAVTTAATYGATWLLTPELCICGAAVLICVRTLGHVPHRVGSGDADVRYGRAPARGPLSSTRARTPLRVENEADTARRPAQACLVARCRKLV